MALIRRDYSASPHTITHLYYIYHGIYFRMRPCMYLFCWMYPIYQSCTFAHCNQIVVTYNKTISLILFVTYRICYKSAHLPVLCFVLLWAPRDSYNHLLRFFKVASPALGQYWYYPMQCQWIIPKGNGINQRLYNHDNTTEQKPCA